MNTMTYKGYIGSVNYSDKDQVFFGKIEGIIRSAVEAKAKEDAVNW